MPNMLSERATAYRGALRQGLNDGLSIKDATDLAKKAARDAGNNFPEPPKPPVELTDAELRLIDENELTADECDRLLELERAKAQERDYGPDVSTTEMIDEDGPGVYNCVAQASLHGSIIAVNSDAMKELAEALGQDEEGERFMDDIHAHEAREELCGVMLKAPGHIRLTIDARRAAKLEGNCEEGYEDHTDLDEPECKEPSCVNNRMWAKRRAIAAEKKLRDHGDEPVDMGDFGAGTLADAWRDAVGIVTPAGLRMTGKAAFMAKFDDGGPYNEGFDNGDELVAGPFCVSGFPGPGVLADLAANKKPRDCDIPATLRAIEIPATEHNNSIRQWFDGDDEMQQFLAGRCLYADADRSIKDQDGKVVGMWFYAHFGPTPVS